MALKIVGSSPIIHPIKNGHPKRVSIFYGIRRIMGLEEGGGSVAAVKNSPVDCFLARGRVPRRQANLCGKAADTLYECNYLMRHVPDTAEDLQTMQETGLAYSNAVLDMNGASCVIYPNGQELVNAFAKVWPGDFDAILMDVQMPVMNGLVGAFGSQRGHRSCMDRRTVSFSGMLGIPPECSVERLAAAAAKEPI